MLRFLLPPSLGTARAAVGGEIFAEELSAGLGEPVLLSVAQDYAELEKALSSGAYELGWAPPAVLARLEGRTRAILTAVREGGASYCAAIIGHRERAPTLEDLRGSRAAWVDPQSMSGYQLPRRHLELTGRDPDELFASQRFYASYERAIAAVLEGEADVTSVHTPVEDEETTRAMLGRYAGNRLDRLRILGFTECTPNDGLVVAMAVPADRAELLVARLMALASRGRGRSALLTLFDADSLVRAEPSSSRSSLTPIALPLGGSGAIACDDSGKIHRLWGQGSHDTLHDLFGASLGPRVLSLVRRVSATGHAGAIEHAMSLDGKVAWLAIEALPAGRQEEVLVTVRDQTATRRTQETLQDLASFPLLNPQPVLELDGAGRVQYANPAARRDLELPEADGAALAEKVALSPEGAATSQIALGERVFELHANRAGLDVVRVYAFDATERVRAERKSRELEAQFAAAERMALVGTIATGVAHEINNPLSFVVANQQLALELLETARSEAIGRGDDALDERLGDIAAMLDDAAVGATRIRRIVRDMKHYARADGKTAGPVDVHEIIEGAVGMLWREIRHRGRLVQDLKADGPALADEGRLVQALVNLIVNAAQSLPLGRVDDHSIRISTRSDGDRILIDVADTGGGIPLSVQARIFEPFFTTKPTGEGTGLGLWITRGIVESMGGTISFRSEIGAGTTFTIALPAAKERIIAEPRARAAVTTRASRGRILIVDDEAHVRRALRRLLRDHTIVEAGSGREALARLYGENGFDVVICDLMMPDLTGADVHRRVRRDNGELAQRFIFLTGAASAAWAASFLEESGCPWLDKPFDADTLRALVADRIAAVTGRA